MCKTKGKVIGFGSQQNPDPVMDRTLMAAIDETIAQVSTCRHCGGSVHLETTPPHQAYKAWLVCDAKNCARKFPME